MANLLYNGIKLPELPQWNTSLYPYAYIKDVRSGTNSYYLVCKKEKANRGKPWTTDGIWWGDLRNSREYEFIAYCCNVERMKWELAEETDPVIFFMWDAEKYPIVWANEDIMYDFYEQNPSLDGTVYLPATDPVPVYE